MIRMSEYLNITLVVDTYGVSTNGTTITAMRSAEALRARGHRVRIITGSQCDEEDCFATGYNKLPILYQITKSQGMFIAKADKTVLNRVLKETDIVHFLLPFKLQKTGKSMADDLEIPSTAAFHLQPENITSTLYLNKIKWINHWIYRYFKRFYDQFDHVHCPSVMIKNQLVQHDYQSNIHVISNGVEKKFKPEKKDKPDNLKDKFVILMIGRLSREKRQDLIIDAVKNSTFEEKIQVIFAGKGPNKNRIMKLGRELTNEPMIHFYEQDELQTIINYADLYVHASDFEIEAISCIEAFSCGLVPVISNHPMSATNQFALSEDCLFKAGDSKDLQAKIEYFMNHPEKKQALSKEYITYGKAFSLDKSIDQLEAMFYQAIEDKKKH